MGIFKHIKYRKPFSSTDSKSFKPTLLEKLEPRILLSGDGLLNIAPDPLDSLLDTMPQVVQYAELLDANAQAEEQISQELTSSDTPNSDVYKPILTLSQDDNTNDESVNADLSVDIVSPTQVDSEPGLQLVGSGIGTALVLGVDLFEENDVEPIGEDVDSEYYESCQRQLIIEQLTDTLRVPHGPPGAEGVLASLDNVQLEYVDAGGQIDLVIRLNTQISTVIEVFDNNEGGLLASYALSEINSLTVIGGDNSNDTLTVDLSNPFSIPGGIIFAGGDGGYDKLVLIGNSELTAEYVGEGDDDGTVIVFGEEGDPTNVSYSGLEPFVYLNEFGAVVNSGVFNYGNSPEILNVGAFSQTSADTLQIEIGGLTPGPGTPVDNGYDQINVTGDVLLAGTLEVVLINDFTPSEGDTFDFITFTGSLLDGGDSGTDPDEFDNAIGLFGFGDGSLLFEVVVQSDRLQLVVKKADAVDMVVTAVAVDMVATIDSYLASEESGSVIVTEANLGGFLDLFTLTLDFSYIIYSSEGEYESGIVYITTQTGELFPGQSAFADIIGVGGTYNPETGQFGLTLETFGLNIPSVLTANAENVTIEYDTAGASDQTLVKIDDFTMVLHVLDDTTAQVNNLIIRQDGFSVENASVSVATATWLNTLELSNFDLAFTDFNFSTSGPTLAGTIAVSATTIKLFPSQDFFTTEITTFSGSYDLGTTALSLSAENLKIEFSDVLLIELGTTSFSMDAGAGTFSASVASGTLSSPRFADLPSISVTNLVINQAGFSFDEATLGSIDFEIGDVLTIDDFEIVVTDFNYSTSGGLVSGTVGFAFTSVGIFPGQSLFTAQIDNFSGSYDIVNKALNISADNVVIHISDLLKVTATGVDININPFSMSFGSIVVTSPKFPDISGTLTELEITETGFSLGSAILSYGGDISIGPLTVNGLAIGIMDYEYSSETPEPFSGSILFYSGGASLVMGGSFSTIISDTDEDGIAISATLNFEAGVFKDLQFVVDKLEVNIGTFLTFTTTGVDIDTGAENDDFVISFSSISASVKVGGLSLTGTARNFGVTASGNLAVIPGETFGVMIEIGGADGSAFKWPSWLPIKINAIGLECDFAELQVNPLDFTFILSASVSGLPAVAGLEFSGVIEGLRINPGLLLEGKFPVTDIASIGVSVSGKLFGGEINAGLIGGILKIAETSPGNYEVIDPMDTETEVYDRVLFMGVQGGFSMPGIGGLTIRFALSELGPLGVFLNIEVPGGIVLEPITGLAVNDFAAGVEFFKSLPSIDDPLKLRDPAFSVSSTVSADTWLAGVKGQVFDQYVAMKSNPNLPGFLAAFTSPMLIKGSAKIYTIYTSQYVFNGQVDLILSTDGKFLISGKLNFVADNISISGKLYADLSNVLDGEVTVLFLADIPEEARLLSIDGKLKMGFRNEAGEEVEITVVSEPVDTNAETSGDLAFPGNGEMIDAGVINSNLSEDGSYYVDVMFQPGANKTLDYSTILDPGDEILVTLTKVDGTPIPINFDAVPLPIETSIIGGISEDIVLTAGTQAELISLLESLSVQRFRYLVTTTDFTWDSGVVDVTFVAGSWNQSDGSSNSEEAETFTILGPTVDISNPSKGGRIEVSEFDGRMYLDLTFVPTRTAGAIVDDAPLVAPVLSGPGLGSISILGPPTSVAVSATFPDGSMTLRYELSGQFATGEVTITFDSNTFQDSSGFRNTTQILSFIVDGATADLSSPGNGDSIGINVLEDQGYIDVIFSSPWDFDIDLGTLNDYESEIEITLSDGTKLAITDDPTDSYDLDGKTVFRYSFTGTLIPGTATVVFLDDSFADMSGLANIAEDETFFIDQPTATFSNLASGATYLSTSFNNLVAGQQVGIYEDSATERYFELTLIPTNGADIDESTIQITDLQIAGLSGISIDSFERVIEQIEDDYGNPVDSPTNRFRFFFSGSFPDQPPAQVTFSMAAGAWQDTAENESGEMLIEITVRKPAATFYLELEGGITLNAAGLLEEPIFDVRGYVNFEAKLDPAPRFELEFGGTFEVIYFGNIASVAGKFVLEIPEKLILDFTQYEKPADDPAKDPDAVTAGDLLEELIGITLEENDLLHWIQLPKLWGVIKLETNFEKLKEVGIDLKAEALLQINTTQSAKTEIITLEGIPGDVFAELGKNDLPPPVLFDDMIGALNSDTLPDELKDLFVGDNVLHDGQYKVETVIGGVLWKVIDEYPDPEDTGPDPQMIKKQYFIQLQDVSPLPTEQNPSPASEMKFLLRGETQEFTLQPKMLRVMAYGQAIFRLPAYTNPEKTEMGPEWFRMTGAFSFKLSVTSLEVFQNGQLTISPAGHKIFEIRSMAVLIIESDPDNDNIGFACKIKLGANIELPGVLLMSGNMEAFINTFGVDKIFEVPGFLQPVVGFDIVTIYGIAPILNPNYDPADAESSILIPNDDPDAVGSPYLTIAARSDLHLGDTVVLQGAFRLSVTMIPSQIEMSFSAALSETHVGAIATAAGMFVVAVDVGDILDPTDDSIIIYGAARLTTELDFLEYVGLFMETSGFLRINSSNVDRSITLPQPDGATVDLPAKSFALRLDGSIDFRIDFNGIDGFEQSESVFEMTGIFVLEFSTGGFNAAVFSINGTTGEVEAAVLRLGPKGNAFIEFQVFAFLAIRDDGFAAHLAMSAEAALPGDLASISAGAVFIVNTTGDDVDFEIPGGAEDPNRPEGLSLTIPGEAPSNPSGIIAKPDDEQSGLSLEQLINGDTSWDRQTTAGAYGVVFLDGSLDLVSLLGLEVSGYILLSKEVISLELNFCAGLNFLKLVSAQTSGTVFFSSEGEFEVDVDGYVQLGPDWLNIHGSADLLISYLDDNGKASGGNPEELELEISGSLSVGLTVDIWPFPPINLDVDLLTVNYDPDSGEITVSIPYPEPFWDSWLGIPYLNIRTAYYNLYIGTFKIDPPPPPVLGQVVDGVLTLNVGPQAYLRNLLVDEVNEGVEINQIGTNTIRITMFGVTQEFINVNSILIDDMDTGDDTVEIGTSVTIPVTINHFGEGMDRLNNLGSGVVIAYGDEGNDRLDGGSANDQLFGGPGDDFIDGKAGQDWIEGNDDIDTLIGGIGSDTIIGGTGGDLIAGDLANVTSDETASVFETIASASGGNDTIGGGDGADIILGGSGNDVINGDAGEDLLIGDDGILTFPEDQEMTYELTDLDFSGNDFIDGGADNDILYGQGGSDTINGNDGNDYIEGNEGGDTIHGNSGLDVIYGHTGNDIIYGDEDRDLIYGNSGNDELHGGSGNDDIYGDVGIDTIFGDDDDDVIHGNEDTDYIYGGDDNDKIYGEEGDDVIDGGDGQDIILGDGGTIQSGMDVSLTSTYIGHDTISGGGGEDYIYGQRGDDTIYGEDSSNPSSGGGDYIEGNQGDDTIFGNGGGDTVEGNDGNDIIIGNAGTDTIYGHGGNDILIGDDGSVDGSSAAASGSGSMDYIYGQEGEDKIFGGGGSDYLYGFEKDANDIGLQRDIIIGDGGTIIYSSKFNFDHVTMVEATSASGGNDTIQGNEGDDIILAGAGGDENVQGNTGNDIILGDNGTINLNSGTLQNISTIGESTGGSDTIDGTVGNDIIIGGPGGDDIYGREDSDILIGDNGSVTGSIVESTVEGSDGEDDIYGQEGEDKILGGGEGDYLYGDKQPVTGNEVDPGNDIIIGDGGTITYLSNRFEFDDVTNITNSGLSGGGADTIEGNTGDDIILGGAAGDPDIQGNSGDDTILGDNGTVVLDNGNLVNIDTRNEEYDGADTIQGNEDNDIIIGGPNGSSDVIEGNEDDDIILGDNGLIDFAYNGDTDLSTLDLIRSENDNIGGDDILSGNDGEDVILGGKGGDIINGDEKDDIILGDNGEINLLAPQGNEGEIVIRGGAVVNIHTTDIEEEHGGADTISGGTENDIILGGVNNGGEDNLNGNAGNDVILGDNGQMDFAEDAYWATLDRIESEIDPLGGVDVISGNAGDDVAIGGTAGDIIYGDDVNASADASDGEDILIGDNGHIILSAETTAEGRLQILDNNVEKISTTDTSEDTGGVDTIEGNAQGDVILGGVNGDTAYGDRNDPTLETIANDGNDVILGDNGELDFDTGDGDLSTLDKVASNLDELGGIDTLSGNAGDDVAIGGTAGDQIYGDDVNASAISLDGQDILLGDNAQINLEGIDGQMHILSSAVKAIRTTDDDQNTGGEDTISGNAAGDFMAGGVMGDDIYGDREEPYAETTAIDGNDYILGDNGRFEWKYQGDGSFADIESGMIFDESLNTLDLVTTELPKEQPGGRDEIYGDEGSDVIFGGTDSDEIYGDDGDENGIATNNDLMFGDHGRLYPQISSLPDFNSENFFAIDTGDADGGKADRMYGEEGDDIMLGQQGQDVIFGGNGDDDIYGGHNMAGGHDTGDIIDGSTGNDVIVGDNASIQRTGGALNPRMRVLQGGVIYGEDLDTDSEPLVTSDSQVDPTRVHVRAVVIFDHLDTPDINTFGNDTVAGGADDDMIFGQLGNDTLHGDGQIVQADGTYTLGSLAEAIGDSNIGGDDYIEGNGGDETIYGGLGQDDIIGGSSTLFGLNTPDQRPDGSDTIYGGNGDMIARNNLGDETFEGHARDADMILGDNGNIYRLVGTDGTNSGDFLAFNYDNYSETMNIVPRAAELLDYTPGGLDYDVVNADNDIGAPDEIHGESGDDFLYGMKGDDVIFGEGQDDDLIGGWGHDWISCGTGDDGVLGDDGRIYTSRNGTAEPLYGVEATVEQNIYANGKAQQATINIENQLKKTVNLTPFNVDPDQDPLYDAKNADDIIYGGLGNDWLHGGSGDDAISGAEALEGFYDNPDNPGDYLGYDPETGTFTYYDFDQDDLLYKIEGFYLNFEAEANDGDDVLFGDLGNDWLVGGTDSDHLYGGYGTDVLNVDDNLETNNGTNNMPDQDTNTDIAYGGAGRDVLIANTEADRLIDWMGEFNSYLVPFAAYAKLAVSREPAPSLMKYLYDLSESDGADQSLGFYTDPGRMRNGEPFGELGLVNQKDPDWYSQTGAPRGPQAGNTPGKNK